MNLLSQGFQQLNITHRQTVRHTYGQTDATEHITAPNSPVAKSTTLNAYHYCEGNFYTIYFVRYLLSMLATFVTVSYFPFSVFSLP